MKIFVNIVGVILIVGGIAALSYKGFQYSQEEQVAKVGSVEITANTEKTVTIPPLAGGLAIAIGVVLLVAGRFTNKK